MPTHYRGTQAERRALDAYIKLMRATNSVTTHLERQLAAYDLTENQFGALEMLYHLGPTQQGTLSRKLFTTKGNVTALTDRLERLGFITRSRDDQDRRAVTVSLTDAGRTLVERILPGHVAEIVRLMDALEIEEQVQLGALCKKLGLSVA
jgi:MarR family 2-MHQ and catechol resistance regulon transcriptional repressor